MKVPEPEAPRLYTISPSAPFLATLARAVLDGDLPVPGGSKPDPLGLPNTTIYLPTRRAARALREAFLAESGGQTMLLPRIRTLGQTDEDAALIRDADSIESTDSAPGVPAIGTMHRHIALVQLILALGRAPVAEAAETETGSGIWRSTPGQASRLAADFATLMDFVESEEVNFSSLDTLVPDDLASHWQTTLDFLTIVTELWPEYLADNALVSPVARRNLLMAQETRQLAQGLRGPVIAAGSTGTVPATARLLETIANLENGAVVLPGLDRVLDDDSWAQLAHHPEHPQAGMADLLHTLGVTRNDVRDLPGSAPDKPARARLQLVSEALRPAETMEHWQDYLTGHGQNAPKHNDIGVALKGLQLVVAPTAHDEAEAIALILKSAAEAPGRTAALITPDRVLARRVASRLAGFGLAIDDSAGSPLSRTVPGAFLDLALDAVATDFAPPNLMALLKHPLTRLGRPPAEIRTSARALERGIFRDVYLGQGLDGIVRALEAAKATQKRGPLALAEAEFNAAFGLVRDLERAFAPLADSFAENETVGAARLAEAHAAAAEALARDEAGSSGQLWQGDAGEALTLILTELIGEGTRLELAAREYPAFYRSLLTGAVVRPHAPAHPRLSIWGPLEARLQRPDIVILGSLNEGTWPRPEDAGPWLSRPMREKLGLPPPERRIGLSAHDFAQALGAPAVFLTRALKVDGVPTVPSRWLQRLEALVGAAGLSGSLAAERPWTAWARSRDHVDEIVPAKPPEPRPPVGARPRALSVTRVERWIASPYDIFARNILKLQPLKPLGAEPDAALRGSIIHDVLHIFACEHPRDLPDDIYGALLSIADTRFAALGGSARVAAFWRPHFERFARWFADTEPARRVGIALTRTEVDGSLELSQKFRLTARADRIDIAEDGTVRIYDYKTGTPPIAKHVDELFAPQLPLEAAIAQKGGFTDLGVRDVTALIYIAASGRGEGGEERHASKSGADSLAALALENIESLVAHFDDEATAYEVKRRSGPGFANAYRYDDYAQLARVKEWLTQDAADGAR